VVITQVLSLTPISHMLHGPHCLSGPGPRTLLTAAWQSSHVRRGLRAKPMTTHGAPPASLYQVLAFSEHGIGIYAPWLTPGCLPRIVAAIDDGGKTACNGHQIPRGYPS